MPKPGRRSRPREMDFREVNNAVLDLVRSGCGWRMLAIHFGAWQTVGDLEEPSDFGVITTGSVDSGAEGAVW